ncbi:MAG TPA: DUF2012 domain-containing protein [Pyrinomonadaceae bacterium]
MKNRLAARLTLACVVVCLGAALAVGARASRVEPAPSPAPQTTPQTFNLSDFGAVGDGVTDDGPAIQTALNAVMQAGGGTLLVPAGRFAIVTPVFVATAANNISIEIRGVESATPIAAPTAGGDALSRGLNLTTHFLPRTGSQVAFTFGSLRSLLIQDIDFLGTPNVGTDAFITLSLVNIPDAVIRHSEFYGLASIEAGGAIVQNWGGGLTIRQTAFLGCTANSGLYMPVVQNYLWESITVEDAIFIDYGQRPELYAKTGIGSPLSWINVGHPSPPTADSPRREVVLRNIFLDEGGWQAITVQPSRYQSPPVPIDLFHASGIYTNVSNFNTTGFYITGVQKVMVEDSIFTWSHRAESALDILDAQDAILDRLRTFEAATRFRVGYLTERLTVIDSTYTDLASSAVQTIVLTPATPDDDPVRYVRAQFQTALGRAPDAAAHYYWSRKLLDCGADASCLTSQRAALAAYLAPKPAATFAITGRATDDTGQPLAGVAVTLTGTYLSATFAALTGADGSYSFSRLPTSGNYTVSVGDKRHYTFTTPTRNVVTPTGNQVVDFPARLNRFAVAGRLLDERGRAIQGATLTLSGAQTGAATSDANGNYSFASLGAGGNYTVNASSTRYTFASPSKSFTDLDADKTADFNGTSLFFTVGGQVVDSTNKPLASHSVALSGGKTATVTTDLQGNFNFIDVPRGGSYTVTPAKLIGSLFTPASKTFDNLTNDQTTTFTAVPTNFKISGRVTSGGTGLSGVTVTLTGSRLLTTTTDASGNYSFTVPVNGDYVVAPSKTHYTFDRASATFNGVTADRTADFVATVNRHKISGSVKRANGAAMSGVTVTLSGNQAATATTDAQGAYSFANLPAGAAYTVTPSRPGYDFAPASKSFTDLGADQTADFTVTPSNVALAGRVTVDGAALAGVTVTLSGARTGTATTDANGNYSFTVTSEGGYIVTPTKAHYKFAPASLTFNNPTAAQTADFAATLDRHKISGRVLDKHNVALASVSVSLSGAQTATTTTDAQGNYAFNNLAAGGNYTVGVSKANYSFSPVSVPFNDLGADQVANFTGTLLDYVVRGRVTSGAASLAGVTVTLSGSKSGTATTDSNGNYSFTVPAEGNYTVTPSLKHYTFAPASASFNNLGGDRTADFAATLNRHTISGRVADKNGAGVQGATVTLSGSQTATATTDAQGNFSFANLPAGGNYTLNVTRANYTFAPPSIAVNDLGANSASNNFTGTQLDYALAGRVTADGAPVAGVTVTLTGSKSGTATTDSNGGYSFNVPADGSYTVTPSKKNYTFAPQSRSFNNPTSAQTADFDATLQTVLSFASTSYAVSEGGGFVTITVTREGDTTTEVSAVYEGHGGTAKLGSDFVATIGLLHFAPGETSKDFALFITDDGFAEGPELFTLTLDPLGDAVTGETPVASVTINDNDATTSPVNPIDDDEFFVRQHYRDFFSREPDAPGLKFWTDEIAKCGTNVQCREARRVSVSAAFFLSIEFRQTGFLVYRLYRATFGRVPSRVGEFMLDSRVVGDGVVVGADGWPEKLAANKRAFLEEWTQRPEFVEQFGLFSDYWFLQTLFVNMNVTPTEARRQELLARLAAGATRAEVLGEVIEDEQFSRQEFNRAFVLMQYFGYLRRNPNDPPDSDLTGYNHWLGKLEEFGGDYERAEMVKAFLAAAEYRGRFGN